MSDEDELRPQDDASGKRKRPYSPPDVAWVEEIDVKRNLAAARLKADPFGCPDSTPAS